MIKHKIVKSSKCNIVKSEKYLKIPTIKLLDTISQMNSPKGFNISNNPISSVNMFSNPSN